MSVYDINYELVVKRHTPVRLRKPRRLAWMHTLVAGIVDIYTRFVALRSDANYYLAHNSQVCYMEAALNDAYDNGLRRVRIVDPFYIDPVYIYMAPEELEVPLALVSELPVSPDDYDAPVWLYMYSETSLFGVQFIVEYPDIPAFDESLGFDPDRMKALIGKYRLPSKRNYILRTYEL